MIYKVHSMVLIFCIALAMMLTGGRETNAGAEIPLHIQADLTNIFLSKRQTGANMLQLLCYYVEFR